MKAELVLLIIIDLCIVAATAAYALMLRVQITKLTQERSQKKKSLDKTAKLLVEKNLELFDENIKQQKQIETKEDFVEIVAHQLRTPATEIVWGLEGLREMLGNKIDEGQKEYFAKMLQSAERMVRLIDDLVKLVSLGDEYSRVSTAPCEPDVIIRAITERVAAKFAEKKIALTLKLDVSGMISGIDADSFDMIASNLIENAYHYTPEHGSVSVTTKRDPAGQFVMSIADTGVGISQEKQKTIFKKFQRSTDAARMNAGGMGLGLYIVHNIAARHKGSVSFVSEEGKGSTFTFTCPAEAAQLNA